MEALPLPGIEMVKNEFFKFERKLRNNFLPIFVYWLFQTCHGFVGKTTDQGPAF